MRNQHEVRLSFSVAVAVCLIGAVAKGLRLGTVTYNIAKERSPPCVAIPVAAD
jgi:hypothetical protein